MASSEQYGRSKKRLPIKRITGISLLVILCAALVLSTRLRKDFLPAQQVTQTPHAAEVSESIYISKTEQERIERKAKKAPKPYAKPAEAHQFFLEQRTGGEPLDYALIESAKAHVASMPLVHMERDAFIMDGVYENPALRATRNIDSWSELGPGNIGGRTRALLVNPNNNQIMYAAGVAGGVWKTTNGGAAWNPLDDLMDNLAVVSMAFAGQGGASLNTNIIYASTGEGVFNADAVRGAGIFKSINAGATWFQLPNTANFNFNYVNKIVASANDVDTLYAATSTAVFKTIDGGATWNAVLNNSAAGAPNDTEAFTARGFMDIEIRTDISPDTLIAHNGRSITDGIYRSLNAGATWNRVFTTSGLGRADLAIAPSDQNVMYALAADAFNGNQLLNVYRSGDGGFTWIPQVAGIFNPANPDWLLLSNPLFAKCLNDPFGQGWYDNIIAVSPHNANVVFAGGVDLFRSDNGGADWGIISHWWRDPILPEYSHADQHTIVFDPGWNGTSNQTLYIGSDGGISKTDTALAAVGSGPNDGICLTGGDVVPGVVWMSLNNGYGVTQFYNGRPFPGGSGYFGGTQDNGTLAGSDAGGLNGWVEIFGGDGGYVTYSSANTNILFAETTGLSIRRSTNAGINFQSITNNIIDAGFLFITPFRMDPINNNRLWIGGDRAWRSVNASSAATPAAVTWTQASVPFGGAATAWAIDPNDGDNVWVGNTADRILHTDIGTTSTDSTVWTDRTPTFFGSAYISWLEVDANDATGDTIYVTNSQFNGAGQKVWKTTNRGVTWTDITGNLPDIPVHCIVVQPNKPTNLYIGTELGVFSSQNGGGTWASMNSNGFANTVVESLEFDGTTTLFAFTHGRGTFRATVLDTNLNIAGTDFAPSGNEGGPLSPTCQTYTLTNIGGTALNWTASESAFWLDLSLTSGTLGAGASVDVDACINNLANFVAPGNTLGTTITFTDLNTATLQAFDAGLNVSGPIVNVENFSLDSDPGWSTNGDWAYGTPLGMGSSGGDPLSGHTGTKVYGYNLSGDYQDDLPERALTTAAIDCSKFTQVTLNFWRWLSIENHFFDTAKVQVSNDGSTWTDVWEHSGGNLNDSAWVEQTFDISAVADQQPTVFIRWTMGPTDFSNTYPGWNIDDVVVSGEAALPMGNEVWVDFSYTGTETGSQTEPYNTFDEARRATLPDGTGRIRIKGDTAQTASAETSTVLRPLRVESVNGPVQVGTATP